MSSDAETRHQALGLAGGAVRLSDHVLRRDPGRLAQQLWGRLSGDEPDLRPLLDGAIEAAQRPWLRPVIPRLTAPGGPLVRTLAGHGDSVSSVAVLPDGRAVSGSHDGTLRIWALERGETLQILRGHDAEVSCLAVLPDGRVVSGSGDTTLRIWNPTTGQSERTLTGHTAEVTSVAVLPWGFIVSGSADKTLRIWDPASGETVRTLEGHTGAVTRVVSLADGEVVSLGEDERLRAWDLETGEATQSRSGNDGGFLAALPDGQLASGYFSIEIEDWVAERTARSLQGHEDRVTCCVGLSDDRLVSAAADRTLRIWQTEARELVLSGHGSEVQSVAVLPGGRIASGAADETLRIWDPVTGTSLRSFQVGSEPVSDRMREEPTTVQALSDALLACASGQAFRILDLESGECLFHENGVGCFAVLPNRQVVFGSLLQILRVWDPESREIVRKVQIGQPAGGVPPPEAPWEAREAELRPERFRHRKMVTELVALADGRLISVSGDFMRVWDLDTGEAVCTLEGHKGPIGCVTALANGRLASASQDGPSFRIWDTERGKTVRFLKGHYLPITSFAELPDGRVVSGSMDQTLRIWDPESGESLRTLEGAGVASCLAVLPKARIVSGGADGALRIWDSETGECVDALVGHCGSIRRVALLADGRVLSGSNDATLRIWALEDAQTSRVLEGHRGAVTSLAATPEGFVVSGSDDRTVCIWDPERGELPRSRPEVSRGTPGVSGYRSKSDVEVECLAVLADGRVASGSLEPHLRLWDPETGAALRSVASYRPGGQPWLTHAPTCLAAMRDGRLVSGEGSGLRLWDPDTGECRSKTDVLSDGRIVHGVKDRTIREWYQEEGRRRRRERKTTRRSRADTDSWDLHTFVSEEGVGRNVRDLGVLPDGRVVSAWSDWTVRIWDAESGEGRRTLQVLPTGEVFFDEEDRSLGYLLQLDLETLERYWQLSHRGALSVAVLGDGRVACGWDDRAIRVWDPERAELCGTFECETGCPVLLAALPDGRLLSGAHDGTVQLWDPDSGASLGKHLLGGLDRNLRYENSGRTSWGVLPDSRVVTLWEAALRVWDPRRGICLADWIPEVPPTALATGSDGLIIVGDLHGDVHLDRLEEPRMKQGIGSAREGGAVS